ncbi:MAG: hypothetical protein P8Y70_10085 [Candidatus Lokiarchaeota archaeon]
MDLPAWFFNVEYHIERDYNFEDKMIEAMTLGHKYNKPIFPIIQTSNCPMDKERFFQKMKKNRVPVFDDPLELIRILQKISNYYEKIIK